MCVVGVWYDELQHSMQEIPGISGMWKVQRQGAFSGSASLCEIPKRGDSQWKKLQLTAGARPSAGGHIRALGRSARGWGPELSHFGAHTTIPVDIFKLDNPSTKQTAGETPRRPVWGPCRPVAEVGLEGDRMPGWDRKFGGQRQIRAWDVPQCAFKVASRYCILPGLSVGSMVELWTNFVQALQNSSFPF
ncbi:hypothetical protein B0H17DRAFT_1123699 [Mycena rosella]|uniref:Uncharacterized protein n=1 Tax=Mycena rosella TaxID=1033263 RepID=A0AAD7H2R3_MYCRO|nr:hypothetical protein B0H17DRAFT_1123699 [Mycena rosella]